MNNTYYKFLLGRNTIAIVAFPEDSTEKDLAECLDYLMTEIFSPSLTYQQVEYIDWKYYEFGSWWDSETKKTITYLCITSDTMYCGTRHEEYVAFEGYTSYSLISNYIEELANDNAESYEYMARDEAEECEDDYDSCLDFYYDSISGTAVSISEFEWRENYGYTIVE